MAQRNPVTEPSIDPNRALPWWARPGKLVWFGLAAGLGGVLATLGSLGFALAHVLARLLGTVDAWTLRFLELGLALALVIPAQLVFPFYLRNRFDRLCHRQAPTDQASHGTFRGLPMSNEAFWMIGVSGLVMGAIIVLAVWIFSGSAVAEKAYRDALILTMVYLVGTFTIGVFFFLARGTNGFEPDEEANKNE